MAKAASKKAADAAATASAAKIKTSGAEGKVRQVIGACTSPGDDADGFVDEIGRCAAAHLARVSGGGVLQSAWRLAVRGVAQRALHAEVNSMRKCTPCP